MSKREITELFQEELRLARARFFMSRAAFDTRIAKDYKEKPELLTMDLAYVVMAALCTSAVIGA